MREYVHDVIVPKARSNNAVICVTRDARSWDLPEHKNIVVYKGGETRAAYLTLKSRGGEVIADYLGLKFG